MWHRCFIGNRGSFGQDAPEEMEPTPEPEKREFKSNDPLHGVTLKAILEELVNVYGWEELSRIVPVRCFMFDPSITSSLKFLRKTPWARTKVERLFLGLKMRE